MTLKEDDEFVKGMIYAEKKFADWLRPIIREIYEIDGKVPTDNVRLEELKWLLEEKIKQLRSEGNKPFDKSLEGKDK